MSKLLTNVILWGYYTVLLAVMVVALPVILVHCLLFDDDCKRA